MINPGQEKPFNEALESEQRELEKQGLIIRRGDVVTLTEKGRAAANAMKKPQ